MEQNKELVEEKTQPKRNLVLTVKDGRNNVLKSEISEENLKSISQHLESARKFKTIEDFINDPINQEKALEIANSVGLLMGFNIEFRYSRLQDKANISRSELEDKMELLRLFGYLIPSESSPRAGKIVVFIDHILELNIQNYLKIHQSLVFSIIESVNLISDLDRLTKFKDLYLSNNLLVENILKEKFENLSPKEEKVEGGA